mmetsp:Transcript_39687/g.71483  ORF Transcript_39687/g.71483 Transcript_39687/m.71483 type:complete len:343 (-) Transcript_39687:786-1814(-)
MSVGMESCLGVALAAVVGDVAGPAAVAVSAVPPPPACSVLQPRQPELDAAVDVSVPLPAIPPSYDDDPPPAFVLFPQPAVRIPDFDVGALPPPFAPRSVSFRRRLVRASFSRRPRVLHFRVVCGPWRHPAPFEQLSLGLVPFLVFRWRRVVQLPSWPLPVACCVLCYPTQMLPPVVLMLVDWGCTSHSAHGQLCVPNLASPSLGYYNQHHERQLLIPKWASSLEQQLVVLAAAVVVMATKKGDYPHHHRYQLGPRVDYWPLPPHGNYSSPDPNHPHCAAPYPSPMASSYPLPHFEPTMWTTPTCEHCPPNWHPVHCEGSAPSSARSVRPSFENKIPRQCYTL